MIIEKLSLVYKANSDGDKTAGSHAAHIGRTSSSNYTGLLALQVNRTASLLILIRRYCLNIVASRYHG